MHVSLDTRVTMAGLLRLSRQLVGAGRMASLAAPVVSTRGMAIDVDTGGRTHGGLSDEDRIFTNLYNDTSPYLKDALKRVRPAARPGERGDGPGRLAARTLPVEPAHPSCRRRPAAGRLVQDQGDCAPRAGDDHL